MSSTLYRVVENGTKGDDNFLYQTRTYSPAPGQTVELVRDGGAALGSLEQQSFILTPVVSSGRGSPFAQQTFVYATQSPELRSPVLNTTWGNDVASPQGTLKRILLLAPAQDTQYSTLERRTNTSLTTQTVVQNVEAQSPNQDKPSPHLKQMNVTWGKDTVIDDSTTTNKSELTSPTQMKCAADFTSDNSEKLDPRYFGELLADLNRKTTDTYSCLLEHVEKIRGKKHDMDTFINYKGKTEDVESLIPKGVSELTKQQIRYLLQMRITAEKSQRLLLATFSSLREELSHLEQDLRRLDSDKESLQRDLGFKEQQVKQYEKLLETVRENNRQLQQTIKEGGSGNRKLEEMILSLRNQEADKEYRVKELDYAKRVLEKENETLRLQLSGQCTSPTFQTKSDEISRQYLEMVSNLREEKDKEIRNLRDEISRIQREVSTREGSSSSTQMKVIDLNASLEEKEAIIRQQNEEIFRLKAQQAKEASSHSTRTVITKKYSNQYPILGLLTDYKPTSPIQREHQTVIEKTEKLWK